MSDKRKLRFTLRPTQGSRAEILVYDDTSAEWRKANDGEREIFLSNALIRDNPQVAEMLDNPAISDEMGGTYLDRFKVKWLAQNKQAAIKYYESIGYRVKEYGDSFLDKSGLRYSFAIKPKNDPTKPWKFIDPSGYDIVDDPKGAAIEFAADVLDHTVDILQGSIIGSFVTGGGLVGGPPGMLLAGGAAGFGTEAVRQGLGQAAGIPQTPDPAQSAAVGVFSGAGGPMAETVLRKAGSGAAYAAKWVKDKVADGALELSAKIVGVKQAAAGTILSEEALVERAINPKKILKTPYQSAKEIVNTVIDFVRQPRIEERKLMTDLADKMLDSNGNPLTGDIRPILARMEEMIPVSIGQEIRTKESRIITDISQSSTRALQKEVGGELYTPLAGGGGKIRSRGVSRGKDVQENVLSDISRTDKTTRTQKFEDVMAPQTKEAAKAQAEEPNIGPLMLRVLNSVHDYLQTAGIDPQYVPIKEMENVTRLLQAIAKRKGAYKDVPIDQSGPFARHVKKMANGVRQVLLDKTDNAVDQNGALLVDPDGRTYGQLREILDYKMGLRRDVQKFLGISSGQVKLNPLDYSTAEMRIGQVYGTHAGSRLNFLREVERMFGVDLIPSIREANIGTMVGRFGEVPTSPRLTATGQVLGMALAGGAGAGLGAITGMGPVKGGAIGLGLGAFGLAAGSPAVNVAGVRAGMAASRAISGARDIVGPPMGNQTVNAINQAVRNLLRESEIPREKPAP